MSRIFLDWGEAGAVMFFDVPSILLGFISGVVLVLLIDIIVLLIRRGKHDKRNHA